jgi:hypothetical protein
MPVVEHELCDCRLDTTVRPHGPRLGDVAITVPAETSQGMALEMRWHPPQARRSVPGSPRALRVPARVRGPLRQAGVGCFCSPPSMCDLPLKPGLLTADRSVASGAPRWCRHPRAIPGGSRAFVTKKGSTSSHLGSGHTPLASVAVVASSPLPLPTTDTSRPLSPHGAGTNPSKLEAA